MLSVKVRTRKMNVSIKGIIDKVFTNILARLRHRSFHTVYEANLAVKALLKKFNDKVFQKDAGHRLKYS